MRIWLFDIDGTLIVSGGAGQLAMAQALHTGFGKPADTGKVRFSGRTDRSIAGDLFAYHQIDDVPEHWGRFVDHYLHNLPLQLGRCIGTVLPHVPELLQSIRALPDQAIGLLTGNIPRGAAAKLGHYQLAEEFEFGFYGDRHWDRNDLAREAAQWLAHQYDCPAQELDIWVVGDTPRDIDCARAIHARVIAVATGNYSVERLRAAGADVVVQNLTELELAQL